MIYHHADCNKEMCTYGRPQLLILLLNTKKKVAAVTAYCKWGTNASTAKTTALALCYFIAEYAAPVWPKSLQANKLN